MQWWLASAPVSRAKVMLSTWCGKAAGVAAVLAIGAISAEVGAGPAQAGKRFVTTLEAPRTVLLEAHRPQTWTAPATESQLESQTTQLVAP